MSLNNKKYWNEIIGELLEKLLELLEKIIFWGDMILKNTYLQNGLV